MLNRELLTGFIRLHVLHHASHEPVFGVWLIEELREHGYRVGPGTLYPLLHGLEQVGYLRSKDVLVSGRHRRVYEISAAGRRALGRAKVKLRELCDELFEDDREHHVHTDRKRR
jgi:PadR family transcriptional regulator, regulatory protein PadR